MSRRRSRRAVLASIAGVAVAGCAGLGGEAEGTPTTTPSGTATETTTGTATEAEPTGESETQTPAPSGEYTLAEPVAFETPDERQGGVETYNGVQYAESPQTPLYLNLYAPAADGPHPLIVHVHGGGWRVGSRGWPSQGRWHANRGVAAASIDYRLSETANYPAAVRDVVAALTWLRRAVPGRAGIDPDRVALTGFSAGAHLSALVGNAIDIETFHPPIDPVTDPVQAVVSNCGIYHLSVDRAADDPAAVGFFGCTGRECPDRYEEASPAVHVDGDSPPTLLYHGTADTRIPYETAVTYRDELAAAGVPVTLLTGERAGHVPPYSGTWDENMREAHREFLTEHLDLSS